MPTPVRIEGERCLFFGLLQPAAAFDSTACCGEHMWNPTSRHKHRLAARLPAQKRQQAAAVQKAAVQEAGQFPRGS
jgi:type II secretory pathway component PulM